jgi:MFS family permease
MTPFNEAATMRKVYGRLMPLLFAMMFFNYLDRINIGFAALDMNKALGFSPAVFGFAGSIFFVGYMLLEVPSNLLLHRVGARRWIARILLTWGAVAAVTAFVFNDKSFYVLRFLLGVMEAGFLPGVAVYLTKWFPERYRARAVGGYIIAGSFSAVLGGPISTALMTYANGVFGLQGWQWMFILEGVPAMLLGLLTLRIMTERPADADWLADDEKQWLESTLAAEREAVGGNAHFPLLRIASDIRVWSLACLFGCALVGIYGLFLWLPQIVKSLGQLSNIEVGFLSAAPPLLGVLGTFIISRSSDRTGDRKKHLAFVYGMSVRAAVRDRPLHLRGQPALLEPRLVVQNRRGGCGDDRANQYDRSVWRARRAVEYRPRARRNGKFQARVVDHRRVSRCGDGDRARDAREARQR